MVEVIPLGLLLLALVEDFIGDLEICGFILANACLAFSHSGVSDCFNTSLDSVFS